MPSPHFNKASFPTEGAADNFSVSNATAAPLVRYRLPLGDRATFSVTGAVGILRTTVETGDETLDQSTSGFSLNGGAGVSFYLIDNFAVNFGAVYQRASIDQDEVEFTVAGVTVAVGLSVLLGGN